MEELLREIRDEIRLLRKLHENAFGIKAESIQELGVGEKPSAIKRLSISKNDGVMFEEEVSEGKWANSLVENIRGRLAGLSTRLTEGGGQYGQVLYGYLEINADIVYSIRFNTEKNFSRLLVSIILAASYEQLAGVVTLSVRPGTTWKSTRLPNLSDSFGFKIETDPIPKEDWLKNRSSYLEQAAVKIRASRSNVPSLGMNNNAQITPSSYIDTEASPSPDLKKVLVQQVVAEAKAVWGEDTFKTKGAEYSAKHFGGLKVNEMAIWQLERYLVNLTDMKEAA